MHYEINKITGRNIKTRVNRVLRCIKKEKIKYNSIVVQGVSGMSVGFPLAEATGKNICVIRKPRDDHHGRKRQVGSLKEPALIVDDFMDSGETVSTIVEKLNSPKTATVVLYDQTTSDFLETESGMVPIYGAKKK